MPAIPEHELRTLVEPRDGLCLSLYLPTIAAGPEVRQNSIRFKNLLREAEQQIDETDLSRDARAHLLRPLREVLTDDLFWNQQDLGLAVFRSADTFRTLRLPIPVPSVARVNARFHLKPLLRQWGEDGRFHVLALSLHSARLFDCSRHHVEEVPLPGGTPHSVEAAIGEVVSGPQMRAHAARSRRGGTASPMLHGHLTGEEPRKEHIRKYFALLDQGVCEAVRDHDLPLVVAGVEFLLPIYRSVTHMPNVLAQGVPGNPEMMDGATLRDRGLEVLGPLFRARRDEDVARLRDLLATGRASSRLDDVVPAAFDGRVEALFVAAGNQRWGRFDVDRHRVELHDAARPGDEELLDFAAVRTFMGRGAVYVMDDGDMPVEGPVAAMYRY